MNILVITKTGEVFFTIKEFLERKGHQVQYTGVNTHYTKENVVDYIPKKFNELNSVQKIDLILIDFFLKNEEFKWSKKSDLPSVVVISNLQKENSTLKVAFMADYFELSNNDFHQNYKGIDPSWLLIHKPDIDNFAFTNEEEQFMNCPYMFDDQLNRCQAFIDLIECKKIDCFYNQILLAAETTI